MPRQAELFEKPKRPRTSIRNAHVIDAGDAPGGGMIAVFKCVCGWKSRWMRFETVTKAKRGMPCPVCNKTEPA